MSLPRLGVSDVVRMLLRDMFLQIAFSEISFATNTVTAGKSARKGRLVMDLSHMRTPI